MGKMVLIDNVDLMEEVEDDALMTFLKAQNIQFRVMAEVDNARLVGVRRVSPKQREWEAEASDIAKSEGDAIKAREGVK